MTFCAWDYRSISIFRRRLLYSEEILSVFVFEATAHMHIVGTRCPSRLTRTTLRFLLLESFQLP